MFVVFSIDRNECQPAHFSLISREKLRPKLDLVSNDEWSRQNLRLKPNFECIKEILRLTAAQNKPVNRDLNCFLGPKKYLALILILFKCLRVVLFPPLPSRVRTIVNRRLREKARSLNYRYGKCVENCVKPRQRQMVAAYILWHFAATGILFWLLTID